jgi:hypothetical protein
MKGKRSAADHFKEMVDGWVLQSVEDGVTGFGSLVCALPGVYPSVVREAILRLGRSGRLPIGALQSVVTEMTAKEPHRQEDFIRLALPMPHPLDFDWRYAAAANERLLEEYATLAKPPGRLAVVGAPSLVLEAFWRNPSLEAMALDSNRAIVRAIRRVCSRAQVIHCDVMRGKLPAFPEAAVVIADPPWYPEHLHSFLWAGCQMCELKGHALVSLPPLGTRPGIANERAEFLAFAEELGLRLIRLEKAALPYLSPPFEQNALRADGTAGVPVDWRRGDLAVFARVRAVRRPRPVAPPLEAPWHEAEVRGVRVRMRPQSKAGFIDPRLASLVAGDILPSVSRRDPLRPAADVWTAGNRIFQCRGTGILRRVFEALGAGQLPVERVADALGRNLDPEEAGLVKLAAEQASNLISMEQDEQSSWRESCWGEAVPAIAI